MIKHIDKAYKKEYEYFIKVLFSSAFQKEIPLPEDNINWSFLYQLARFNSCQSLFFNGVQGLPAEYKPPLDIYSAMEKENNLLFAHDVNQMYELEQLFNDFEKNQIYFMPLKGYIIKPDYPRSDFRLMTDADILFKSQQIDKVMGIFKNRGFKFNFYDNDNQYHFEKKPFVVIEMHTSLVKQKDEKYDYFLNIWEKSRPKDGCKYHYLMTSEDYYIFMIEHASNHFKYGGIGLRHLLDIYLYNKKHKLNRAYLDEEFKNLDLLTFEEKMFSISVKWFENQDFESFSLLEESILLSSTLGRSSLTFANLSLDHKRRAQRENKKNSKFGFFLSTVFPGKKAMSKRYRYLEKAPYLLPVSWIQFWFKRLFIDKDVNIKIGIKNRLNYISDEDEEYINTILRSVGFEEK